MNAARIRATVKKNIAKYGVDVEWPEPVTEINSRGVSVTRPGATMLRDRVILLKERFNPINSVAAPMGTTLDTARYIICLPETKLEKDVVITDAHGRRWRLDEPDWFDIKGVPVCKQAPVIQVGSDER